MARVQGKSFSRMGRRKGQKNVVKYGLVNNRAFHDVVFRTQNVTQDRELAMRIITLTIEMVFDVFKGQVE